MHFLTVWLVHYGYIVLFGSLLVELVLFGIPTEILMTYAGLLIYQQKMSLLPAILSGIAGSIIGVTLAYFIGRRLGAAFFDRYGSKVHLGPERVHQASLWIQK